MAALVAASLGFIAPKPAPASTGVQVEANVPFSFTAGIETLPAGRYVFTVDDPMEPSELTIQRKDGSKVDVVLTATEPHPEPANDSKLVFDQYGTDHFLAKVVVAGFDEARVLPKQEIQREYARLLEQREVPLTAVSH